MLRKAVTKLSRSAGGFFLPMIRNYVARTKACAKICHTTILNVIS